uniref:Immunoglobulin V-set domain-containing protein n=1 Tax=Sphaeramia orbicularis TaxID=375764 RepID=A0A672ZBI8_9TELE
MCHPPPQSLYISIALSFLLLYSLSLSLTHLVQADVHPSGVWVCSRFLLLKGSFSFHCHQSQVFMDLRNQSPGYRNRTRSFPLQYKDGNFSLVLMKVDGSDAGLFECHIIPEGFQQNVRLNVTTEVCFWGALLKMYLVNELLILTVCKNVVIN